MSLFGMEFSTYIMPAAYASALILLAALVFFIRGLPKSLFASLEKRGFWFRVYFYGFIASFLLKMALQVLSVLPPFQSYASYNKFIIIAYLHLSLIGSISFLLLALFLDMKWLTVDRWFKAGSILLLAGFGVTEILLALAGLGLFYDPVLLAVGSGCMAFGILTMILNRKAGLAS